MSKMMMTMIMMIIMAKRDTINLYALTQKDTLRKHGEVTHTRKEAIYGQNEKHSYMSRTSLKA